MSQSEITTRPLNPWDKDDFKGFIEVLASRDLLDPRRDTPETYARMALTRPGCIRVATTASKEIVGTSITTNHPYPILGSLAVLEGYEGRGIGTQLVNDGAAHLAGEGSHYVEALVSVENRGRIPFFEKLGFRITDVCFLLERSLQTAEQRSPAARLGNLAMATAFDVVFEAPPTLDLRRTQWANPLLRFVGSPPHAEPLEVDFLHSFAHNYPPRFWSRLRFPGRRATPRILRLLYNPPDSQDQELDYSKNIGTYLIKKGRSLRAVGTDSSYIANDQSRPAILRQLLGDAQVLARLRYPPPKGTLTLRRELRPRNPRK
jgi:ribosomal protein S18 acetylase RimI-like enzyme